MITPVCNKIRANLSAPQAYSAISRGRQQQPLIQAEVQAIHWPRVTAQDRAALQGPMSFPVSSHAITICQILFLVCCPADHKNMAWQVISIYDDEEAAGAAGREVAADVSTIRVSPAPGGPQPGEPLRFPPWAACAYALMSPATAHPCSTAGLRSPGSLLCQATRQAVMWSALVRRSASRTPFRVWSKISLSNQP